MKVFPFSLRTILLFVLALGCLGFAQDKRLDERLKAMRVQLKGTVPGHWRVLWAEHPESRAVISWSTAEAGTTHTVHFDTKSCRGKPGSYGSKVNADRNGGFDGSSDLYYHHATLTGLKADTIYYFVVSSDGSVSRELHFRTAPKTDKPFSLIQGGDSRSNHDRRRAVNRLIALLAAKDASILAFAHGGDYVASGTKLDQWKEWLSDHELTVTDKGRVLPILPVRGNHEARGRLYNEVFPGAGKPGEEWYKTLIGPQLLLVTLNTNDDKSREQTRFLEESLKSHPKVRWQLVQYHRPVYPAVKSASKAKDAWVSLFEKYNIDLACEADGHCIKRTLPIRNDKPDPTGVVYIGEGGLGVDQRSPDKDEWYLQRPGIVSKGDHVFLLGFTKTQLTCKVILVNGRTFDAHVLKARRR